jgi:hypothetical protein
MSGATVERILQRRVTERFIAANPTQITLLTRQKVMSGGTMSAPQLGSRAPQTLRIIWLDETGINGKPPEGSRKFDFALLGAHDATMAIGDYWKVGEQEFVLEAIAPSNGWEVKAYGVSHGPKPT